jgi:hypothetical protein
MHIVRQLYQGEGGEEGIIVMDGWVVATDAPMDDDDDE